MISRVIFDQKGTTHKEYNYKNSCRGDAPRDFLGGSGGLGSKSHIYSYNQFLHFISLGPSISHPQVKILHETSFAFFVCEMGALPYYAK